MDIQKEALRLADRSVYLKEKDREEPKESFKAIYKEIKADYPNCRSVLDVGCAYGEFLYFLKDYLPSVKLAAGLDVLPELLDRAKAKVPGAKFFQGGIDDPKLSLNAKFDAVIMTGVLGIFFDLNPVLDNMVKLLEPKGTIYIFSGFNEDPIDVRLTYRRAEPGSGAWESGHNMYSMKTMETLAKKYQAAVEWVKFQLPFPIKKTNDPMRSWTEPFRDNPHTLFYGTGQYRISRIFKMKMTK